MIVVPCEKVDKLPLLIPNEPVISASPLTSNSGPADPLKITLPVIMVLPIIVCCEPVTFKLPVTFNPIADDVWFIPIFIPYKTSIALPEPVEVKGASNCIQCNGRL